MDYKTMIEASKLTPEIFERIKHNIEPELREELERFFKEVEEWSTVKPRGPEANVR